MTETVPSVWFATKRRVPFGVIVHPRGSSPTGISPITVKRVSPASETTDTVPLAPLVTKASLPAGSTATKRGATPTGTSASFAKTSRSPLRTCSTARLFASPLTATTSLSFFVILMVVARVCVRRDVPAAWHARRRVVKLKTSSTTPSPGAGPAPGPGEDHRDEVVRGAGASALRRCARGRRAGQVFGAPGDETRHRAERRGVVEEVPVPAVLDHHDAAAGDGGRGDQRVVRAEDGELPRRSPVGVVG